VRVEHGLDSLSRRQLHAQEEQVDIGMCQATRDGSGHLLFLSV